ncbi:MULTISPECIES: hypothetical protein [unclassified Bradyrhizobium]|uniref:SGNH/GDSL hydrolase family protein n=1 Tax=unclassified Bradyrhizobium TaxID=2631580 RepID=UPI001BA94ED8|nr:MULTISPECIES: hypothetical protein [unclassified Bradyrhizobium]MBR1228180.1 hypothetical protein [Bradyrhizobium sp. AUGA SZCCT0176]MBR1300649.1 hypothetical protein [Bradyrhizobium sp. AUGA SZCCT0042]
MNQMRQVTAIISILLSVAALAGVSVLGFAYENLRRQMAGISSDLARLPNPSASHEHFEARLAVIRSQISRVQKPIIVMGDSIVETAFLPASICGHPVINAGIGGATIGFFVRYAEAIVNNSGPVLVVMSVGINDAVSHLPEAFRNAYQATLQSLPARHIVLAITPARALNVEPLNDVIREITENAAIELPGLHEGMTIDGIHLDQSGYAIWNNAVLKGVETALSCSSPTPLTDR